MRSTPGAHQNGGRTIIVAANDSWYIRKFRGQLIVRLLSEGWRVVAATGDNEHRAALAELGAELALVPLAPRSTSIVDIARAILSVTQLLRQRRPAAVLTFNPMTSLVFSIASRLTPFFHVSTVSGLGAYKDVISGVRRGPVSTALRLVLQTVLLRWPDVVVSQNDADNLLCRRVRGAQRLTAQVPGSGVDLDRYARVQRPYQPLRVLFASRLLVSKGVVDFVDAAKSLADPGIQFTICGLPVTGRDGVSEDALKLLLQGTNIRYRGYVDDMASLLQETDVVVLPSRYGEGIPRILIEGAASGCILVAYDQDGTRSIVLDGQNGRLLQQRSAAELSKAIADLRAMSEDDLAGMSERSRELAENEFAESTVIQAYVSVIEDGRRQSRVA